MVAFVRITLAVGEAHVRAFAGVADRVVGAATHEVDRVGHGCWYAVGGRAGCIRDLVGDWCFLPIDRDHPDVLRWYVGLWIRPRRGSVPSELRYGAAGLS